MDSKEMKNNIPQKWIFCGIAVSLICSVIFVACYGTFRNRAERYMENPIETENNLKWVLQNNRVLYRDLYNWQNNTEISYIDLYHTVGEEIKELNEEILREKMENGSEEEASEAEKKYSVYNNFQNWYESTESYYESLEAEFEVLIQTYDYWIRDNETDVIITNTSYKEKALPLQDYYFYMEIVYDEYGNASVGEIQGENEDKIRRNVNEILRSDIVDFLQMDYVTQHSPSNITVCYGITYDMWKQMQNPVMEYRSGVVMASEFFWDRQSAFSMAGVVSFFFLFLLAVGLLGMFLPMAGKEQPWKCLRICRPPIEILCLIAFIVCSMGNGILKMVAETSSGMTAEEIVQFLGWQGNGTIGVPQLLAYAGNIWFLTILFWAAWYIGICLRAVREEKLLPYLKKQSVIYKIFPWFKRKLEAFYDVLNHFDVTKDAKKLILKLVLLNGVVLFFISIFWAGGLAIAAVYSVLLYFVLRKYISNLQKKYSILLKATNEIAEGNLNVCIPEDLGVFEPFKPQVIRIQRGFKNAVEEEVKSQRMKAELITNVSHDLKTPLTAIITYVDLLKQENITEEQRKEYLDTLDRKSLRLKALIEDLFEVSKANSGNVSLNIMKVDIVNLIKQVELEMSDKLTAAQLEVRMNLSDNRLILPLDSQKTYRIYANLFGNVAKYAMPHTRVYVDGYRTEDKVVIQLKNITAEEIHVSPEELTDRFVRGDSSRNTEGSGLGLAIAKSFTELQDGKFSVEIDGDLFKVTTEWKLPEETFGQQQ